MYPDSSPLGLIGVLTVSTRGATGPGEVLVKIRGGSEAFLAWSDDPLPKGATVLVVHSRGTRTVDVTRWIEPFSFTPVFPD